MDIETAANPADGTDTPVESTASEPVTPEAQTTAEGTTTETETTGFEDLLPPEDDVEEVDYEGAKYKVPKPLKEALLRHSDYTRKTMELAEQRRALEADKSVIERAKALTAAEIKASVRLDQVGTELAQFQNIDWKVLDPNDPDVQKAHWRFQQLQGEFGSLKNQLDEHFRVKNTQAQQETAKAREESDRVLTKEIKGWTPEKRQELETFAVNQGIPQEVIPLASASELKILNLAHIGQQFIERQRAAAKAAAQSKAQPASEVGGGGGANTSDPSLMSMEQYVAARSAGKL